MIRHANARVERQDHKRKEFYQPATKLRLSSYITDSLNSVKCRMKLCFMNYALARITSTMFNSYARPGHVLWSAEPARWCRSLQSFFNGLFSFYVNPPTSMHKRSSGHPVRHRKKMLPPKCHRLRKVIPNINKNICASVNSMRQLCGRSVYIVSRRSAGHNAGNKTYSFIGRGPIRHVAPSASQREEESTTKDQGAKFFSCLVNKCVVIRT